MIYQWLAKFRKGGMAALEEKPVPGRPAKLRPAQLQRLYELVVGKNPLQLRFAYALWTRAMIQEPECASACVIAVPCPRPRLDGCLQPRQRLAIREPQAPRPAEKTVEREPGELELGDQQSADHPTAMRISPQCAPSCAMSRNYALFAVFFTALIVLLIHALTHSGWPLAHARLIDALLGCGIALGIGYVPWPSSWHVGLRRDYAAGLDTAARYLDQALGQGARDISVSARTQARRQVAALHTEFQRSLAEPRRVRQGVTAWWPALVALEQLLDAIAATAVTAVGQPPPATAVSEVSAALRQIAASVRSGKPPDQRLPSPPSLARVTDAVRSVQHSLAETPTL